MEPSFVLPFPVYSVTCYLNLNEAPLLLLSRKSSTDLKQSYEHHLLVYYLFRL